MSLGTYDFGPVMLCFHPATVMMMCVTEINTALESLRFLSNSKSKKTPSTKSSNPEYKGGLEGCRLKFQRSKYDLGGKRGHAINKVINRTCIKVHQETTIWKKKKKKK